ncbi:MAG: hypothetical protein ABEK59_04805 [Halobacteria archaeon]
MKCRKTAKYSKRHRLWNLLLLGTILASVTFVLGTGVVSAENNSSDGSLKDCKGEECEKQIQKSINNIASFFAKTVLLKGGVLALLLGAAMWAFSQKNANRAKSGKYMMVTAIAAIGLGALWRSVAGLIQSWFFIHPAGIV